MSDVMQRWSGRAGSRSSNTTDGRSPWVIGIIIGFVIMVLVNIAFITIAVKGADAVVPSYETAER